MNALRAFEAAARHASIKAAADELCVTPAAISQQIKKLEENIPAQLFRREHRKVVLTDAGRRLRTSLSNAFSEIRASVEDVASQSQIRELVVCAPPQFAAKFLAPKLGEFFDLHPEITIKLEVGLGESCFHDSEADVRISGSAQPPPGLISSPCVWSWQVPLATPEYIEKHGLWDPSNIASATLLECSGTRSFFPNLPTWQDWFNEVGLSREVGQREIDFGVHYDQAFDAAVAGTGIVISGFTAASILVNAGKLACPFGPRMPLGVGFRLVHSHRSLGDPAVNAFKLWLQEEMEAASAAFGPPEPGT